MVTVSILKFGSALGIVWMDFCKMPRDLACHCSVPVTHAKGRSNKFDFLWYLKAPEGLILSAPDQMRFCIIEVCCFHPLWLLLLWQLRDFCHKCPPVRKPRIVCHLTDNTVEIFSLVSSVLVNSWSALWKVLIYPSTPVILNGTWVSDQWWKVSENTSDWLLVWNGIHLPETFFYAGFT